MIHELDTIKEKCRTLYIDGRKLSYFRTIYGKNVYIEDCSLGDELKFHSSMCEFDTFCIRKEIEAKQRENSKDGEGDPMCDYGEMLSVGWDKEVPYIIWPQAVISQIIDGIKYRKNIDIVINLRAGKMKYEVKELNV